MTVLGGGSMATAVATLVAHGGGMVRIWARKPTHAGWVVEDVADEVPSTAGRVSSVASLREAVVMADVVVPALPWGPALGEVLTPMAEALSGKVVVDVCNPYEMTALGPKLAMSVPGGSAAAALSRLLRATTTHLHCFTHLRADRLNQPRPGDGFVLPYVVDHQEAAPEAMEDFLGLVAGTGWLPTPVGSMDQAALIEEGGPWAAARGAAGQGLLTRSEATAKGLLR